MEWKTAFVNHILDKELISKIYRLIKCNSITKKKKPNNLRSGQRNWISSFPNKTYNLSTGT